MPVNHVAENVLGTMGTICWTIQLVPQIWLTYRTKSVEGLSEIFMLFCGIAGPVLGTYSVVKNLNVPLILQPQMFGVLCLACWSQCQYYGHKRSLRTSWAIFLGSLIIFAGFEVGMIYAIRPSYNAGNMAPTKFFGIFSTVLIAGGLMPQYYEIYKHKEVVGISLLFMTIDMLGGIFNDLSLAFKGEFDVIAGVTYSVVVVLDAIILLLALILNPIARRRRKRLAAEGVVVPDVEAPTNTDGGLDLQISQPVPQLGQEKAENAENVDEEKREGVDVESKEA